MGNAIDFVIIVWVVEAINPVVYYFIKVLICFVFVCVFFSKNVV